MNRKGFAPILIFFIIAIVALSAGVFLYVFTKKIAPPSVIEQPMPAPINSPIPSPTSTPAPAQIPAPLTIPTPALKRPPSQVSTSNTLPVAISCTQEARQCSDGSYVSRTGKNCEFTKCPAINLPPVQEKTCQTPVFTKPLVAPDRVSNISPLGTPNRPNRTYVSLKMETGDSVGKVSLYAPADIRLMGANWYIHPLLKQPMWALSFDAGCGVTFLLGHVIDVVDKIKVVGPPIPGSSSAQSQISTPVSFTAGELIGSISIVHAPPEALQSAAPEMLGFDFVAWNTAVTNQFANQARYILPNHVSDFVHAICPYDLFSPELRSAYTAKYGGTNGPFVGATCGYVSHDVPGTISGQWYINQDSTSGVGAGDNWGVNFTAFAEGVSGFTRLIIDEGTDDKIHMYSDCLNCKNNPTYIDPANVRDSHCYQNDDASYYVYARLASSEIINIASGAGSCPGSFPNSGYKTFYR